MGKIRLSTFLHRQARDPDEVPALTVRLVDEEKAQRAEHVEHVGLKLEGSNDHTGLKDKDENEHYPILPRRTLESDLPSIPSDVVGKRDGKDGRRLCTYLRSLLIASIRCCGRELPALTSTKGS